MQERVGLPGESLPIIVEPLELAKPARAPSPRFLRLSPRPHRRSFRAKSRCLHDRGSRRAFGCSHLQPVRDRLSRVGGGLAAAVVADQRSPSPLGAGCQSGQVQLPNAGRSAVRMVDHRGAARPRIGPAARGAGRGLRVWPVLVATTASKLVAGPLGIITARRGRRGGVLGAPPYGLGSTGAR
jgi:hypothetical protein